LRGQREEREIVETRGVRHGIVQEKEEGLGRAGAAVRVNRCDAVFDVIARSRGVGDRGGEQVVGERGHGGGLPGIGAAVPFDRGGDGVGIGDERRNGEGAWTRLDLLEWNVGDDGRGREGGIVERAGTVRELLGAGESVEVVISGGVESVGAGVADLPPVGEPVAVGVEVGRQVDRLQSMRGVHDEHAVNGRAGGGGGRRARAVEAPFSEGVEHGAGGKRGGHGGDGEGLTLCAPELLDGEGRVRGGEREAVLALPEPDQHGMRGDRE